MQNIMEMNQKEVAAVSGGGVPEVIGKALVGLGALMVFEKMHTVGKEQTNSNGNVCTYAYESAGLKDLAKFGVITYLVNELVEDGILVFKEIKGKIQGIGNK